MDESELHELKQTVLELGARVKTLESRLAESTSGVVQPAPPPFLMPSVPPPTQVRRVAPVPEPKAWREELRAAKEPTTAETEYRLGAQIMPRVGAAVFLVGVLFLVALVVSRGWITPTMQWIGELSVCAILVVVGIFKRREREDFGQILTGIGSCGLYLSFSGANAFKHLIGGEAVVVAFFLLSLANLVFATWTSSRSFLSIGLLGGLVATMLPMQESNIALSTSLHFGIVAATALVCIRHRWTGMVQASWVASFLTALGVASGAPGQWLLPILSIYGTTLIFLAAYGLSFNDGDSFDPTPVSPWIGISAASVACYLIAEWRYPVLHLAGFGALCVGLAAALRLSPRVSPRLLQHLAGAGIVVPSFMVPLSQKPPAAMAGFAALSILYGVFALRTRMSAAAVVAWALGALGLVAYLSAFGSLSPAHESALLLLEAGSLLLAGYLGRHVLAVPFSWGSGVSASGLIYGRLFMLGAGQFTHTYPSFWGCLGLVTFAIAMAAVGITTKRPTYANVGWIFVTLAGLAYGLLLPESQVPLPWVFELGLVLALMAAVIATAVASTRSGAGREPALIAFMLVAALLMRGTVVALSFGPAGWHPSISIAAAGIVYGLLLAVLAARRADKSLATIGWLVFVVSGLVYFQLTGLRPITPAVELALVLGLMLSVGALWVAGQLAFESADWNPYVSGGIMWILTSRLAVLLLTLPAIGLSSVAALTVGWTTFGVILLGVGFLFKLRSLRLLSFAVLGATLAKVFIVDLSSLDPAIRVVVLLGLGSVMLVGGYWYVRSQGSLLGEK